jgi:Cdc6-like AAA superfamily ATPase
MVKALNLTYEQAESISRAAATVFQPRSPITTKDLFAGRWDELTSIADAAHQVGVHVVLYGERGVGKTSLSNVVRPTVQVLDEGIGINHRLIVKAVTASGDTFAQIWEKLFKEINWQDNRPTVGLLPSRRPLQSLFDAFGLQNSLTVDGVRRTLTTLPGSFFIIDEFDRSSAAASQPFSDLIKALSDFSVDCTIMLVGVADTIDSLVKDHASINRALVQIHLPRMGHEDLSKILENAEQKLSVCFDDDAKDLIVRLSQGLPHYTHLIGLHAVRDALNEKYTIRIDRTSAFAALKLAVKQAEHTTAAKHSAATHSGHKDALFRQVLLACAVGASRSTDPLGFFSPASISEPLSVILERPVEVATFNNHLSEFSQSSSRGQVLERVGPSRGFRYRFRDPLLVPYIFMNASATGLLTDDQIITLLRAPEGPSPRYLR